MANKAHNIRDKERRRNRKEKKKAKKEAKERARRAANSPPPLTDSPPIHHHSPPPQLAAPPSLPPSPLPLRIGDAIPLLDDLLKEIGQPRVIGWDSLDQLLIRSLEVMVGGANGSVFKGVLGGVDVVLKVVVVSETKTEMFGPIPDLAFVRNELLILNYIKNNQSMLCNPGIVGVIDIKLVRGNLPGVMRAPMPGKADDQLFFVSITRHQGTPLTHFKIASLQQFKAIIGQVLVTLGMLERDIRFEHRDMHNNNILVEETGARSIEYGIGMVASGGIKVSVIDFTYSRATIGGRQIYLDLASHRGLFTPDATEPLHMARNEMVRRSGGRWAEYSDGGNAVWVQNIGQRMLINSGHLSRLTRYFMQRWLNKLVAKETVPQMLDLYKNDFFKR